VLFSGFLLCKKNETYTQKIQQKHETFVVSGVILFTQPNFMLFPVFRFTRKKHNKSMKFLSCPVSYCLRNKKPNSSFMFLRYATKIWVPTVVLNRCDHILKISQDTGLIQDGQHFVSDVFAFSNFSPPFVVQNYHLVTFKDGGGFQNDTIFEKIVIFTFQEPYLFNAST
jgi:hypothetical protein